MYNYGDIKLNVLMEYNNMSLICEIQFLVQFILSSKKILHHFYKIERRESFMNDLNVILNISSNNQQRQLYFDIHSTNQNKISQSLINLLFCYHNKLDFIKLDDNGMNAFHYVCKLGNFKLNYYN